MKLEKNNKNKLLVYFFYDEDNIIDKYVFFQLNALKEFVSEILFVSNSEIKDEYKPELEKYVTHIFERENKGFDVWAYKEGMEYYGWEKLSAFDEVILMNYTMFGPIYPLNNMFETMNTRDIDFWGITKHHKVEFDCWGTCKLGYIPEHIQSSFIAIRKNMLSSIDFQDYWDNMEMINSYAESIGKHEAIFTMLFKEKGFKDSLYIDTDDLEGYTRYPLMTMADELVINRKCPFIKQKMFSQNYYDILSDSIGSAPFKTMEYITNNTDYDTNLIWDCVLRKFNMADIKKMMHLNYILPKYSLIDNIKINQKIALIVHIYYEDLIDKTFSYIKNMPKTADLIITTPKKELVQKLKDKCSEVNFNDCKVLLIENRGRDVSSLLVGAAPYIYDYDLVCYMHDKKTTQIKPYLNGVGFDYKCFDNLLGSEKLIYNIIETFEKNPRLGMLMPPPPNHGNFYQIIGSEWASNYENTISLLYRLGIKLQVYWTKEPITPLGTMFWFRPQVLNKLFEQKWTYNDFPQEPNSYDGTLLHAVERSYGIVCQYEGYYPAWIMNDEFARIEITNLYFMVRELNSILFRNYFTTNLLDMTEKMRNNMYFKWDIQTSMKYKVKAFIKAILPKPVFKALRKVYRKVRGYE